MKTKKINTVPNGVVIVVIIVFEIFLTLVLGIALLPAVEALGLFAFSFVFLVSLVHYITHKYCNFIDVSDSVICHGRNSYNWENVFITVEYAKPNFLRNSFDYYVFFDDHYLAKAEVNSKSLKRKGFYLILTRKRTKWLLSSYQKEIKILDESPYPRSQDIITQIKLHNLKFVKTE